MEEGQESFISHLVELRDRLIRALVVVLVVFLGLVNWARDIYTLLAAPMLAAPLAAAFFLSVTFSWDEFIIAFPLTRFDVTLPVRVITAPAPDACRRGATRRSSPPGTA
mgnify:CR=1 FL=1